MKELPFFWHAIASLVNQHLLTILYPCWQAHHEDIYRYTMVALFYIKKKRFYWFHKSIVVNGWPFKQVYDLFFVSLIILQLI